MPIYRIRNWAKHQHYKHKASYPWFKFYGPRLLEDKEWLALTHKQRSILTICWSVASSRNGMIPSPRGIWMKICSVTDQVEDPTPDQAITYEGLIKADGTGWIQEFPDGTILPEEAPPQEDDGDTPQPAPRVTPPPPIAAAQPRTPDARPGAQSCPICNGSLTRQSDRFIGKVRKAPSWFCPSGRHEFALTAPTIYNRLSLPIQSAIDEEMQAFAKATAGTLVPGTPKAEVDLANQDGIAAMDEDME